MSAQLANVERRLAQIERLLGANAKGEYANIAKRLEEIVSGAAVDHGGLSGLADDDHTGYLLANGTRALTGALDFDSNQAQNLVIHSMTSTERAAMANPTEAIIVYETDTGDFYGYTFAEPEQSGVVTLSFSAVAFASSSVTFATAFSAIPTDIVLTAYEIGSNTGRWSAWAVEVSSTGMLVAAGDINNTARTCTVYVAWRVRL